MNAASTHDGVSNGLQAKCAGNEACYQLAKAHPENYFFGANEVPDVPEATKEIEKLIARLCSEGMAILFISSELEEVVRDSHRVVVLRDRKKVCELTGDQIDLPSIMQAIAARADE